MYISNTEKSQLSLQIKALENSSSLEDKKAVEGFRIRIKKEPIVLKLYNIEPSKIEYKKKTKELELFVKNLLEKKSK